MNRVFGKPLTQVLLGLTATLVTISTASSEVSAKPQKPLTWKQDVAQGNNVFRSTRDYNLPAPWRNGFVYDIQGANWVGKYVLKPGLAQYPVPKDGLNQIEWADGDRLVKSGKAIKFFWNLGNSGAEHANDTEVRFDSTGGCLRNTCLTAPFISKAQIRKILLSEQRIEQKSLPKTLFLEPESKDKAYAKSSATKTVQQLPSGNYFFGAKSTPRQRTTSYVIFKKSGNLVTGYKYKTNTDGGTCFSGIVKGNAVINPTYASPVFGNDPGKPNWEISTPLQNLDLRENDQLKHRIAFNQASPYDKKELQKCLGVLSKKR